MSAMRRLFVAVACAALVAPAPAAGANVDLSMTRTRVATELGDEFSFASTITNAQRVALSGLVAHLNVVSWDRGVYVDPEDWSAERTRYLPALAPGGSARIRWTVKAVNGGHFAVYVVVLDGRRPAAGPSVDVRVAEHKTLDAGGALPLAVGVPALLAAVMAGVRLRRRLSAPA
jgi:hypothetical protein